MPFVIVGVIMFLCGLGVMVVVIVVLVVLVFGVVVVGF